MNVGSTGGAACGVGGPDKSYIRKPGAGTDYEKLLTTLQASFGHLSQVQNKTPILEKNLKELQRIIERTQVLAAKQMLTRAAHRVASEYKEAYAPLFTSLGNLAKAVGKASSFYARVTGGTATAGEAAAPSTPSLAQTNSEKALGKALADSEKALADARTTLDKTQP